MSHYHFTKTGPLITRPSAMPAPGPYYTSVVDMAQVDLFPFDVALYCSTDHHAGNGGIWLYVCNGCPTDAANWMSYDDALSSGAFDHIDNKPLQNPIFQDHIQGDGHTETPHANVIDGTVYMSYHKNGIGPSQATLMATSDNGICFKRINGLEDSVILSYDPAKDPGDGHTGYFRWAPNSFAEMPWKYIGYSLHGGGHDYFSALWASNDAKKWIRLAVLPAVEGKDVEDPDHMILWHELDPASIRQIDDNAYIALCCSGNRASGDEERVVEIIEIYLQGDGCTTTNVSRRILNRGNVNEPDSEEMASPTLIQLGGVDYLVYVGACKGGRVNTIMGARSEA